MANRENNRVLGRLGARELKPEEVERARNGRRGNSATHTNVITFDPLTGALDGDGS